MKSNLSRLADVFDQRTIPEPNTGCVLWTGHTYHNGYGQISIHGKPRRAHRVAMFLHSGRWPTRLVLHRCDTPACVNPSHLFEGSWRDNVLDMRAKGRARDCHGVANAQGRKTHCPRGHEYAGENLVILGGKRDGHRACKACKNAKSLAWYYKGRMARS